MLDFDVQVVGMGECTRVTVRGELDIATAPQLVEALTRAIEERQPRIVVDLLGTTFVDSTGLTTLFRAHKRLESQGRVLAIVCGSDNFEVRRVIDLMGFDEVFNIYETLASSGCEESGSAS